MVLNWDRIYGIVRYLCLQATILHMVPPIAVMLSKHPLVSKFDVSSVRAILGGAAPLGQQQAEALMKQLGVNAIRQGMSYHG